jgi:hypothetical protein
MLVNASAGSGRLRASVTAGGYNFPTVGVAATPTFAKGANTNLYTVLSLASVQYTLNDHVSVAAGKFAALLGQESPFTYQNLNVQRGLGWSMEPTISRAVQATYANGAWSATLQDTDAYYSGGNRALEWIVGYAPSANANLQFAGIEPGANVPGNPTTAIGNKAEYDLMYTRQIGKFSFLPYYLWVRSPQSSILGYTSDERATAAVLLASYAFSTPFSLALRYEAVANASSTTDKSPNADLIGYGPGSSARTFTLTPAYRIGYGILRLEYSHVSVSAAAPGLAFGSAGNDSTQTRYGFELGLIK